MKLTIIGVAKALTNWNRPGQSHGVAPRLQQAPGGLQLGQVLNLKCGKVQKSGEAKGSQDGISRLLALWLFTSYYESKYLSHSPEAT